MEQGFAEKANGPDFAYCLALDERRFDHLAS